MHLNLKTWAQLGLLPPSRQLIHYDGPGEFGGKDLEQDEMGAVRVSRVGTAFLKISPCVFDQMIDAHPEWKGTAPPEWDAPTRDAYYQFFRFEPDHGAEMGEDFAAGHGPAASPR